MSIESVLQKFAAETIEAYVLVREFAVRKVGKKLIGDPAMQKAVLEFIPAAAANNYLFVTEQCGNVVAMAIAGPTNKPGSLHSFSLDGPILYVHYALIHPQWRLMGKGLHCLEEMLAQAYSRFSHCEVLCYWHKGSYRERRFENGGVTWAGRRSAMVATRP